MGNDLGGCYDFGTSSDLKKITIPGSSSLNTREEFSIGAWVSMDGYPGGTFLSRYVYGAGDTFRLGYNDNSKAWKFYTYKTSNLGTSVSYVYNPGYGNWVYVLGTYEYQGDEASILKLYINGTLVANSTTARGPLYDSSQDILIGRLGWGAGDHWEGKIDEVQIWDRALSADEVSNIYSGTMNNTDYIGKYSKQGDFKSLVFYNGTSTYWNTTFDVADNNYKDTLSYVDTSSLVSYWRLNGDVTDSWGNNDGIPNGGIRNSTGIINGAMKFDGIDSTITVNPDPAPDNSTISFWYYPQNGLNDVPIGMGSRGIYFLTDGEGVWAYCTEGYTSEIPTRDVKLNTWVHVVQKTVDLGATSNISIYFDGEYQGSQERSCSTGTDISTIGARNTAYYVDGKIDEVLFFNDSLSSSEILEIYNTQNAYYQFNLSDPNLVSYWPFDYDNGFNWTYDMVSGKAFRAWGSGYANVSGISSDGISFPGDGTINRIELQNDSWYFNNGSSGAFSFWINPSNYPIGNTLSNGGGIIKKWNTRFELYFGANGKINEYLNDGTTTYWESVETVPLHQWTHVTYVFNTTHRRIYLNGRLDNETNDRGFVHNAADSTAVNIGAVHNTYNYFNGSLDEMFYYNRTFITILRTLFRNNI